MKTGNKLFLIVITVLFITFHGILNPSYANYANLSWIPPTTNVDGTTLTDLAGYKVYYGTSSHYYHSVIDVGNVTSYTLTNLTNNLTYFFAVTAYDNQGNESNLSNEVSKTVSIQSPPVTLPPPPLPADLTPPIISNILLNNFTYREITISWETDEPSTSKVEYGTSNLYGNQSIPDNNYTTSHTVILSALIPDTNYFIRILSTDIAGNTGTAGGIFFRTLIPPQPETPAPIIDIRFNPSNSTNNSAILEWTATGADGAIGTAATYDLRMSRVKIIEDGITPNNGETNFSTATKITGVIAPAPSGTAESFQVNQLDPNSVYFFAIKAIDEKGNVSAISNVVNGNNIPAMPVTAIDIGYSLISIPLTTQTTDAQALLSGIVGSPVEIYSWISSGNSTGTGSFTPATTIIPGNGYILKSNKNNAILNITGTVITDSIRTIPLQQGWNMIVTPYPQDIPLINTFIRNTGTGQIKTYKESVIAGWVSSYFYTYNGNAYSYGLYDTASIKVWQGHWIYVFINGQFELVINKP